MILAEVRKITKTQVKAALQKLKDHELLTVYFLPSKTSYAGFKCWVEPVPIKLTNDLDELEKTISEFKYYYCDRETGLGVHYYIKTK